jgi:alpha-1,2-mannosyltransferase
MTSPPTETADTPTDLPLSRAPLVALAVAMVLAALGYYALVARSYHLDLSVYHDAIRWWWGGHDPYTHLYSVHQLAFTYPPFAMVALSPLAVLPIGAASLVWFVANLAAVATSLYVVCRRLGFRGSVDLWLAALAVSGATVFVLEPVRSTVDYGQVNAVIMAAVLVDLLWPSVRHRGVLVGLAGAVKLTPLAFLLYFAVRRDGRSLARSVVTFLVATGLAWLILPGPSHAFWRTLVWQPERTGKLSYPGNLSWDAVFVRSGLSSADARHLWMVAAAVTVVVGAVAASRCTRAGADVAAVFMVALTGLLVSPVSWSHHWIWVVVALPLLLPRAGLGAPVRVGLAGLLLLTLLAPYWWFQPGGAASIAEGVAPVYAFALLCLTCVVSPRRVMPGVGAARMASSGA